MKIQLKWQQQKKTLTISEENFDRKAGKMSNVLLKQLQNIIAKILVQPKPITDLAVMTEIKINVLMKLGY